MSDTDVTNHTASVVPMNDRMRFLPKLFGRRYMAGESLVFGLASRFCSAYNGGFWEYYTTSNGTFFLSPRGYDKVTLTIDTNGFEGEMSGEAFGLVITIFALVMLIEQTQCRETNERYELLRMFIYDHAECSIILRAID